MGYTANQAQRLFLRHRLVVVGSSPASLSSKGGDRNCFARAYDLEQQQRKSLRLYLASWAVAPRFVVLDEFHLVKRTSTVVYKTLQQLRSQARPANRFKLAALSATPISVSLQQSLKEVLSLIVPADDLTAFCTAAQTIDAATKTGLPRDMDKYEEAMNTCSDLLGRVMTLRTTTDLFHGQVLLSLLALHRERISCRSARAQQVDFQRKMGELTAVWSQEARARFEKQRPATSAAIRDRFFQFARFNQSFMRTLWLGSFPGIVDLPDDISSDPAAWLNSSTMKGAITTKEGRNNHVVGRYIDVITRGSEKMEQLQRCLDRALNDVDVGDTVVASQPALKKHACVFASRPGVALIIAAYADKHWSSQWDVVMVLSAATADGKKAIDGAFRDTLLRLLPPFDAGAVSRFCTMDESFEGWKNHEREFRSYSDRFYKRSLRPKEYILSLRGEPVVPPMGYERLQNEAACLAFIRNTTNISVPDVLHAYDDDGAFVLVTRRLSGVRMDKLYAEDQAVVMN